MIDLYYWPTPNGWKLTILFEELGMPYNVIPLYGMPSSSKRMVSFHPFGVGQ